MRMVKMIVEKSTESNKAKNAGTNNKTYVVTLKHDLMFLGQPGLKVLTYYVGGVAAELAKETPLTFDMDEMVVIPRECARLPLANGGVKFVNLDEEGLKALSTLKEGTDWTKQTMKWLRHRDSLTTDEKKELGLL